MTDHDDEIRDALMEALDGGRAGKAANIRMLSILARATREGRTWPEAYTEQAIWDYTQRRCKQLDKDKHRVWIDYQGNTHHKATVVGRRSKPGEPGSFQQELITGLTWEQLEDWHKAQRVQALAITVNVHMAEKLLLLQAKHPHTTTVQEALDLEGMTLDQYLGSADG